MEAILRGIAMRAILSVAIALTTVTAALSIDHHLDNSTLTAPREWESDQETLAKLLVQRLNSGGWAHGEWELDDKAASARVQRVLVGAQWGPNRKQGEAPPNEGLQAEGNGGGVSETDLYLLAAIEKLAKRVERLESRLMRTEEGLYLLTKGDGLQGPPKNVAPCREGFFRSGSRCYLFGRRAVDWKAANGECRKAGAVLAELETTEEGSYVLSTIVGRTDLRGAEYWTGGLNPGLLWIWSHGGRPVSAPLTPDAPQGAPVVGGVKGGRCLKLAFNPSSAVRYAYEGADCAARLRYVCEDGGPDGEGAAGNALRRWERERRAEEA